MLKIEDASYLIKSFIESGCQTESIIVGLMPFQTLRMYKDIRSRLLLNTSLLILLFSLNSFAQNYNKYWVFFKDKPDTNFDAYAYFDSKAIERRMLQDLPLYDWTDLPVSSNYLAQVQENCINLKMHSRWFNAAVVIATEDQVGKLSILSFIDRIEQSHKLDVQIATHENLENIIISDDEDEDDLRLLEKQTERMGADLFASKGYTGKGIRIAIFDVGFTGANYHPAFQHIRNRNGVLKTWDFVKNEEFVWKGGTHGTAVWSCIAGKLKNRWAGLANESDFLLARTEIGNREPFSEEENWIAAAEWADKNGADIVNSSLGYTDSRYFPRHMDGKTTYITRGANIAARKGMLIVNAMGNEGESAWHIMGAPADADSVLSVGGVAPCCNSHINFSSYGPTRDMRLKPNVCAQGRVFCANPNGDEAADGTSFASPLAAGFAACAWQAKRDLKAMELFKALESSGHLYPYFDYAHGYGVLSAKRFLEGVEDSNTFEIQRTAVTSEEGISSEKFNVVVKASELMASETDDSQYMYYSIMNTKGGLDKYYVINVTEEIPVSFNVNAYPIGSKLRVSYKGNMQEIMFNYE
jgi:subtilisin family serine protease